MKSFLRIIWLSAIILLMNDSTFGYNLRQITNKDNLSNSSIVSLFQDKQGILWIGTCNGLNKFDSRQVTPYQPEEYSKLLSGNHIENIIETQEGILWIQTPYGLNQLDQKKNEVEYFSEFDKIYGLAKDSQATLFLIASDSSVHYFTPGSHHFKKIVLPELITRELLCLYVDAQDDLWLFFKNRQASCYRITGYPSDTLTLEKKGTYRHPQPILSCFQDEQYIYFIDKSRHFYEFDPKTGKATDVYDLTARTDLHGNISSIVKFHQDYFIGLKTNGLSILKKTPTVYQFENILVNCSILCLKKDIYQDLIWIGTDGQGVYNYSLDTYALRSNLLNNLNLNMKHPITALCWDKERNLWLGSKGDGILKINDYSPDKNPKAYKTEYLTTMDSHLGDNTIYSFEESRKNILWIGTARGINYYSYRLKSIRNLPITGVTTPIAVRDIYEQDSILWLATEQGIYKTRIHWSDDIPTLKISHLFLMDEDNATLDFYYSIYPENDSTIQFANKGEGMITVHTENSGLGRTVFDRNILNEVNAITQDRNKDYIVGTNSGLVRHRMYNTSYNLTNKNHGFPNDVIHAILRENDTTFWLSTNRGLIHYNSENGTFRSYNYSDGLSVIEFSDVAAYKDKQTGTLFFGGIDGFVSITKTEDTIQKYTPPIHFDRLVIFGNAHNIHDFLSGNPETLTLGHRQNFFSISFLAIDYLNGNNYDYLYKLEEVDQRWINNRNANSISFTNFAPGQYTLSVKYHNRVTNEESPVRRILIHILPPWYATNWAYGLYGLCLLSFVGLMIRAYRIRSQKKKARAQQILEQQHKEDIYESKLRFFTHIAHEFCTPLTLIYGPCNRILSQPDLTHPIAHYTQIIQQNAERLNSLIRDLIKFRSIESGFLQPRIEELPLSELLAEICSSFSDLAESRNIKLSQEIGQGIHWNSDKEFIQTISSNFISYMLKYTPDSGEIKVKATVQNNCLNLTFAHPSQDIKKEDFLKLFDRYKILENFEDHKHSGLEARDQLGIAISYHMLTLLQGSIDIRDVENAWTYFRIQLPYMEMNDAPAVPAFTSPQSFQAEKNVPITLPQYTFDEQKSTLLLVAAEHEILWFLGDLFTEEYNILVATTPTEARRHLHTTQIDLILCDVLLSESDGISLTAELKADETTAHIPLILLSAKQEIEEQISGIDAGAEMYIGKPFNVDYLKISIKQLLEKKKALQDYFSSPISAFELDNGKLIHKQNKQLIKNILNIIDKNITNKDLSVDFIATEMNMSARNLYRKIGEIGDISIAGMIRDCRLHIAEDLLVKSKLTIDEIIFKSGFANRVSFFKAFARKNGCTPKEFRDQNKVNNL